MSPPSFVLKLTPPGLSRWNQVFALLVEVVEKEVGQRPEDHPDQRGGDSAIRRPFSLTLRVGMSQPLALLPIFPASHAKRFALGDLRHQHGELEVVRLQCGDNLIGGAAVIEL